MTTRSYEARAADRASENPASAPGDQLVLMGYGTFAEGARLVFLDFARYRIDSADGSVHENVTILSHTPLTSDDYVFV